MAEPDDWPATAPKLNVVSIGHKPPSFLDCIEIVRTNQRLKSIEAPVGPGKQAISIRCGAPADAQTQIRRATSTPD